MIKRILVGLGGTGFTSSKIRHAIDLAQRHDASITGVTIFDAERIADVGPIPVGAGGAAHELREHRAQRARERLEEATGRFKLACADAGVPHHLINETGDVFDELISLSRYHDLTVLGLQGFLEDEILDRPQDYLVRLIARGVRPLLGVSREFRPIRRAMIAYNGSIESAKSMKHFVQMALWSEVSVIVARFGGAEDEAKPLLHAACDYCRAHGLDASHRYFQADPMESMLAAAHEEECDLIVMGSTHRSRLARVVFGDTMDFMVRHADLPLFLSQ